MAAVQGDIEMAITLYHLVAINVLLVELDLLICEILGVVSYANIHVCLVLHVEIVSAHFDLVQGLRVALPAPRPHLDPRPVPLPPVKLLPELLPAPEMKHQAHAQAQEDDGGGA